MPGGVSQVSTQGSQSRRTWAISPSSSLPLQRLGLIRSVQYGPSRTPTTKEGTDRSDRVQDAWEEKERTCFAEVPFLFELDRDESERKKEYPCRDESVSDHLAEQAGSEKSYLRR